MKITKPLGTLSAWSKESLDLEVSVKDSVHSGNCKIGTRKWVKKHFPDQFSTSARNILSAAYEEGDEFIIPLAERAVALAMYRAGLPLPETHAIFDKLRKKKQEK